MSLPRVDGRQLRWQGHHEERRRQVIDAALEVIEEAWPETEIHVQQIADRAGINRSVLYRYFRDRADLDVAVQQEICQRMSEAVIPAIKLEGRPREIVHRIVGAAIGWATAHPGLVRFAEQDVPGATQKPLELAVELLAAQVEQIIEAVADVLGASLTSSDRAALEPWVFSMIGGSLAGIRRWSSRPTQEPSAEEFTQLASDLIWHQVAGLAADRDIPLPDVSITEFIDSLTAGD